MEQVFSGKKCHVHSVFCRCKANLIKCTTPLCVFYGTKRIHLFFQVSFFNFPHCICLLTSISIKNPELRRPPGLVKEVPAQEQSAAETRAAAEPKTIQIGY